MRTALAIGALLLFLAVPAVATEQPADADKLVVDRSTDDPAVNDYVMRTRDAIQRAWKTPPKAAQPGVPQKQVRINYAISRGGTLESVEILQSAGDEEFDRSVMDAIRKAAPFPRFPGKIRSASMLIRAKFLVGDGAAPTATKQPAADTSKATAQGTPEPVKDKGQWSSPAGSPGGEALSVEDEASGNAQRKKFRWGM
jgi:TonB family protein